MSVEPNTYFAPPGRASAETLCEQEAAVQSAPMLRALMDAMSQMVLVLNEHRQVVAANRCVLHQISANGNGPTGKRPGDLFGCSHAGEGPDGCGTARECATCGAVEAILESGKTSGQVTRECRLSVQTHFGPAALDLEVTATPVQVDGHAFTVCAVEDISHRKRLDVLTRMFFHDVLNTAGAIRGFAQMLAEDAEDRGDSGETVAEILELADQLVEEIETQRDLTHAECGDLQVRPRIVTVVPFLAGLCVLYNSHPSAAQRRVMLSSCWDGSIVTDSVLLRRVLVNMVKNGLEAAQPGEGVLVECSECGDEVEFRVQSPAVIPQRVQLQIFKRSFSTKAATGRGIGTHSMKLLGERYLGGAVSFTSSEQDGTTFRIRLPKVPGKQ